PDERTVLDLARKVVEVTGSSSTIEFRPLPTDDPTRRCPDIGVARRTLAWEPRVDLDDGLARTVAHFALLGSDVPAGAGDPAAIGDPAGVGEPAGVVDPAGGEVVERTGREAGGHG